MVLVFNPRQKFNFLGTFCHLAPTFKYLLTENVYIIRGVNDLWFPSPLKYNHLTHIHRNQSITNNRIYKSTTPLCLIVSLQ